MKTLTTTTAIACAIGFATSATATDFLQSAETSSAQIVQNQLPASLSLTDSEFYQGHFLKAAQAELTELQATDMYTGMGAAMMTTVRDVT